MLIETGVFPYIYHVGCAFNLHSIIGNGLIPGGQNLSRRQSVFFLPVDPRDEDHKDQSILIILYRVMPDTCKTLGKGIRIRYIGLILILESSKKD